jgi:N4-gp56 family major capsid protein
MAISPASTLTSTASIAHQATVYYDRLALDNLKKALRFNQLTEPRRLPKQFGLTTQMFRYIPFAANTAAGAEGTIGSGIAPTTEVVSTTVAQYFDFVNFSDLYLETVIDDALANVAEEIGYRAGLTVDTLIRIEFDNGSATTSAATIGTNIGASDFRKQVQSLRGNDVKPKEGSDFLSLAHPFVLYDLISESSTGGFIDITKYTAPNAPRLYEGDELGKIAGVRIGQSTNVGVSGAGATTKYWVYVVGKGAVAAVNLGEGQIASAERNPQVNILRHGPSSSDPAGVIGGSVSYNYKFVAKRLKTTSDKERYRMINALPSVTA